MAFVNLTLEKYMEVKPETFDGLMFTSWGRLVAAVLNLLWASNYI